VGANFSPDRRGSPRSGGEVVHTEQGRSTYNQKKLGFK